MENRSWNNSSISLEKKSLTKDTLVDNLNAEKIRNITKANEVETKGLLFQFPDLDNEVVSFFENNTLTDGSVNVSDVKSII